MNQKEYKKIDLHAHFVPVAYKEAFIKYLGGNNPDRFPMPNSNEEITLQFLEDLNVERQVFGVSSPHVNFSTQENNKAIARACNEEMADLCKKHPGRLDFLATLSVPYVDDAIEEIEYSMDKLGAVGVNLPTNTKGVYMGVPELVPLFEALNAKKAIVAFHPNKPGAVPQGVGEKLPETILEFFFDTTRIIADLIMKGYIDMYPDIKFVVPHCGAALPVALDRMAGFMTMLKKMGQVPEDFDVYKLAGKLYYDLAGSPTASQLKILLGYVPDSHFIYGSDTPFTPTFEIARLAQLLADCDYLTEEQKMRMFYDNGKALLA